MDPTSPFADEDGPWLYAGAIGGRLRPWSAAPAQAGVSRREAVEDADDLRLQVAQQIGLNSVDEDPEEKALGESLRSRSSKSIPPLQADLVETEHLEPLDLRIHAGDLLCVRHGCDPSARGHAASAALGTTIAYRVLPSA